MRPELFRFLGVGFPSYFVLLFSGFVFATAIGVVWARRIGEDPDVIVDLGLSTGLFGVIGARLLHVVADGYFWDYVHLCTNPALVDWRISSAECASEAYRGIWDTVKGVCHPAEADCFAWAKFWAGGLAYYGGFIGATASSFYLLKRDRFPFWRAADMAGIVIPVGLAFGRMGCLLAGCCFGVRTASAVGMSFPPNSPASEFQWKGGLLASQHFWSLPVHPTQVYESILCLLIGVVCLVYVHPRKRYDGQVFLSFVVLYAAMRFVLEYLRSDDRCALFGLSTSQLIGLLLVPAAVAVHLMRRRRVSVPPALPA
jgi:phosphatidylglycerol:prolipoprotein diacylglycerol transferase